MIEQIEGRLAQVTEIFSKSRSNNKKRFSVTNGGVFNAVLVDRYAPGDEEVNRHAEIIESDVESDKN